MAEMQIPEPVASFIATVNRHDDAGFLDAFVEGGAGRSKRGATASSLARRACSPPKRLPSRATR